MAATSFHFLGRKPNEFCIFGSGQQGVATRDTRDEFHNGRDMRHPHPPCFDLPMDGRCSKSQVRRVTLQKNIFYRPMTMHVYGTLSLSLVIVQRCVSLWQTAATTMIAFVHWDGAT